MNSKTNNGFNFDSFDRFSDDLCQLLLSYLSISDKTRLECVSKQWKSLIFNNQKLIVFKQRGEGNEIDTIFLTCNLSLNESLFVKLLQKFRFVERVLIDCKMCSMIGYRIFENFINGTVQQWFCFFDKIR